MCADFVSPFTSSPTRPAYCATDVVKRRQSKKKKFHLYEGVRSSDRSTYMMGFQSSDLPKRMFHLNEGVPELRPFHLYEGVPELRPAQEDVPPKESA